MSVSMVTFLEQVIPLDLTIEKEGVGGLLGLAPTVRLRDGTTASSYMDFSDNTFKIAGWTTQSASLSEVGRGQYTRALDLALIAGLSLGNVLVAEFFVDNGSGVVGVDHDVIILGQEKVKYATMMRKAITNRQEEFGGTPGRIILFDDDNTKLLEQELRDEANGGIVATIGSPAKRTANILPP